MKKKILIGFVCLILIVALLQALGIIKPKSKQEEQQVISQITPTPIVTAKPTVEPTEDFVDYDNGYVQCKYNDNILGIKEENENFIIQSKNKPYTQEEIENKTCLGSYVIKSSDKIYNDFNLDKKKFVEKYAKDLVKLSSNQIEKSTVNNYANVNGSLEYVVNTTDNKEYKVKVLYVDKEVILIVCLGINNDKNTNLNEVLKNCYKTISLSSNFETVDGGDDEQNGVVNVPTDKAFEYNNLQKLYLDLDIGLSYKKLLYKCSKLGLFYNLSSSSDADGEMLVKIAMDKEVLPFRYSESGEYLEISFLKKDGKQRIAHIEYYSNKGLIAINNKDFLYNIEEGLYVEDLIKYKDEEKYKKFDTKEEQIQYISSK